jgi:hypothetical protein
MIRELDLFLIDMRLGWWQDMITYYKWASLLDHPGCDPEKAEIIVAITLKAGIPQRAKIAKEYLELTN